MRRSIAIAAVLTLVLAACSPTTGAGSSSSSPAEDDVTTTSLGPTATSEPPTTTSSTLAREIEHVCDYDEPWPAAPEAWYEDTPVYVGNNSPTGAVRRFASRLPGFETVWIDRDHNGWVSAGFVGVDVDEMQALLEAEFPDDGVVAVELSYTAAELEQMAEEIDSALPDEMHALNFHELWGRVEIFVGLLTPENIEIAVGAAGDRPFCLEGLDPAQFDQGPQEAEGDGWVFLGVVDGWLGDVVENQGEAPALFTEQEGVDALWDGLGVEGQVAEIDFSEFVVAAFGIGYSGSCPETRFDGLIDLGDRIMPDIAHTTIAQMCTADYNPRTYVVALERAALPAPPFFLVEWEHSSLGLRVDVDLREPGVGLGPGDSQIVPLDRPRAATEMPFFIEPEFPWELTVSAECDLEYLGEINGVGWHLADGSSIPDSWANAVTNGLIDLEILLTEGPPPTLQVSAAGESAEYVPGDKPSVACSP